MSGLDDETPTSSGILVLEKVQSATLSRDISAVNESSVLRSSKPRRLRPFPFVHENITFIKKMAELSSGRGIQVLIPSTDHTFKLNEEALEKLLLSDEVKDLPAVVISVAGAFRKGKSFLLSFILRYLHQTYNLKVAGGDWLGNPDEPLKGFSWRGGSERHTTGLLLWSQPFIATLESGDKVVIYLMDTQGTFDSESTVKDNATVFALSTMLSSVQIYNVSQQIEEDDLQHLQVFTEYGRLALESNTGKPFQRLQFLVRDWSYPYDHPYGAVGGQRLLEKHLSIRENQHPELQSLRRHIMNCFEELKCFLMPHPGITVATDPNFRGKLSDISAEFKQCLKEFVPMLAAPDNLIIKKIAGQRVKARDLLIYMQSYMNVFSGSTLPEPKSILAATAEANNLSAVAEAKDVYETLMDEVAGGAKPYLQPALLQEEHRRARDKALHIFNSKKKMGGDEFSASHSQKLREELDEQFEQYRLRNDDKNVLRRMGTALVLVALALAAWLLVAVTDVLNLAALNLLASLLAYAAISALLLWGYSRVTGNLGEWAQILDEKAALIMNMVVPSTLQMTASAVKKEA
ncbi:atlastin-like [Melitaea cinxia]|uniref:atlastin-like n=1 Tax=Melitaea cinxia TaxID=113334 RepID=UPI001E273EDB|nr:atlastin-like [Melitaea cinxia]